MVAQPHIWLHNHVYHSWCGYGNFRCYHCATLCSNYYRSHGLHNPSNGTQLCQSQILPRNRSSNYAAYATFDAAGTPLRVLLYDSDYFAGTGTRASTSFVLTGLSSVSSVRAKRLTAASALARQDQGGNPSWGGQVYANGTCVASGTETFETASVVSGQVSFTLQASEALVVYLQ